MTLGVGIGISLAVAPQLAEQRSWLVQNLHDVCTQRRRAPSYFWGPLASLSLATDVDYTEKTKTNVEPITGVSFPSMLDETKQLAGVGVRRTSIYGLKSIHVYAFGLYVDENSLKQNLADKYGKMWMENRHLEIQTLAFIFTSQFKDEYKLSRGTKIQFTRLPGHVLQTKINEQEVGCIQSPLLCRSLFDLYIGDYPFDQEAKEKIGMGLASLLTQ